MTRYGVTGEGATMGNRDALYNEIKSLIDREVGGLGVDFTAGKFTGIGWLFFHYKCTSYDGLYPRISLKQYPDSVHIYFHLFKDGQSELDSFVDIFGKSAVGKGCVRLKKWNEERKDALNELIHLAVAQDLEQEGTI